MCIDCLSWVVFLFCYYFLWYFFFVTFDSDVGQPLSQIRMSLAGSLGAGQIIFLAGIDATDNKVSRETYRGSARASKIIITFGHNLITGFQGVPCKCSMA